MKRNLDRRIEAVTPVEDFELKSKLYNLLKTYINDNYYSWAMKNYVGGHPIAWSLFFPENIKKPPILNSTNNSNTNNDDNDN